MTDYEANQIKGIKKWKEEKPSVVSQAVNYVFKPISWVTSKIIPQKAIQGALTFLNTIAKFLADEKDILRDAKVSSINELKSKDLQISDNLANDVHNWAIGAATSEGGATGWFGLPGMIADCPLIIIIALRTIHKIGLCYGYKTISEFDNQFVYSIMSLAGSNTVKEKNNAIAGLQRLNAILSKTSWKKMSEKAAQNKMSEEALIITIKSLAKQLKFNITKRKALQAIPITGAGLGAAMNATFINDICWAARRSYQERWLIDNGKI